jgi:hypothetical protein
MGLSIQARLQNARIADHVPGVGPLVLLPELQDRQAADAPVFRLYLVDGDEGGLQKLAEHLQQEVADPFDQSRLLLSRG